MSLPRMLRPANLREQPVDGDRHGDDHEFVGTEIRSLRNARGIKLQALSETTGLSIGYLSQVERNISSPTVDGLHAISRALGVTISWFFKPSGKEAEAERNLVVRSSRRRHLKFKSGIVDELLSPNLDRQLELLRCTFPPGATSGDAPYAHQGEEAGIVISGQLEVWIGDKHFSLKEGDSFAFESHLAHRYRNPGRTKAVVIWAITPPTY
ncbi:MAG: cupin domain-containing protein [Hyphomicrobium sp.]